MMSVSFCKFISFLVSFTNIWFSIPVGLEKITYIKFLDVFDKLDEIPKEKKVANYRTYLSVLVEYLGSFVERVKPLLDINEELVSAREEFKEQWDQGTLVAKLIFFINYSMEVSKIW